MVDQVMKHAHFPRLPDWPGETGFEAIQQAG